MKNRFAYASVLIVSVLLNVFLYLNKDTTPKEEDEERPFELYPTDHSSLDFPLTYDVDLPQFRTFSPKGENILFADFVLKGTISDSFNRKYNTKIPQQIIKNIQEIVYFLNGFKIRFREGDALTFFYDEKSGEVLYLRYKNSSARTVSEVYLFDAGSGEKYFTSDTYELQPCITNGPFKGCPRVRFLQENNNLVPVFETPVNEDIHLPFLAKLMESDQSRGFGGSMELIYSNYATRAFFRGLASINPSLKKNALYKEKAVIGKSGYIFSDKKSGVIYYLRKFDNSIVSPFVFHHTESRQMSEKSMLNFQILRNFYSKASEYAKSFEKNYF
ncbi:hypothetical protein IKP13_03045 [bacterium]|nr:hypothetical protein [bacterium]